MPERSVPARPQAARRDMAARRVWGGLLPGRWMAGLGVLAALALFVNASSGAAALEHVVQPGDTLGALALRYGVTVEEIAEINYISNPNLIYVGATLRIPDSDGSTPATTVPTAVTSQPTSTTAPPTPGAEPAPTTTTTTAPPAPQPTVPPTSTTLPSETDEADEETEDAAEDANDDDADDNDEPDSSELPEGVESVVEWTPYTIRPGDWLSSIAQRYDTTVEEIARVNVLSNTNLIYVGQVILVPTSRTERESEEESESPRAGMTVEQRLDYWASHYNVPPEMLKALTWWESGWNNNAISSVGAIGIGQLLPSTADFVADVLIGEDLDPHIIDDNIRMSARFVRYLLDETGNERRMALAAYYQGLFALRKYGMYKVSIPYVNGILALQDRFRR